MEKNWKPFLLCLIGKNLKDLFQSLKSQGDHVKIGPWYRFLFVVNFLWTGQSFKCDRKNQILYPMLQQVL